jgi:hypothetical protein
MATEKEMELTHALVSAAMAVNASNEAVNVHVDVQRSGVTIYISPDKEVTLPQWAWLFYPKIPAYFSSSVFPESDFIERCEAFITEVNKHLITVDADGVPV